MMKKTTLLLIFLLIRVNSYAIDIPAIHPNILEESGSLVLVEGDHKYSVLPVKTRWTLAQLVGNPTGTESGIQFNFGDLNGKLHYGFIKTADGHYPQTVFYDHSLPIRQGQASVTICCGVLTGVNDIVAWEDKNQGILGYRVVTDDGMIVYDGKIAFTGKGPFVINPASIVEGPLVNFSEEGGFYNTLRISFDTLKETQAIVMARHSLDASKVQTSKAENATTHHELTLTDLQPDTVYAYTVATSNGEATYTESYSFHTAPAPGSRKPFIFAYGSDCRRGDSGSGEREMEGPNAYMLKRVVALAKFKNAAFLQVTGDLITGYLNSVDQAKVQYRNWKRVVEPFAHYLPILTTMGNHEALLQTFSSGSKYGISLDRFPYVTDSSEVVFASQFVNPTNGPPSEDGAFYDPNPKQLDFPSYRETVYYYTYANLGMVVLNSDYWYAPAIAGTPFSGGNLHGYLMDQQLEWLTTTLAKLDADDRLDFIFVTQHTPAFPNGNHVKDAMWYNGNNAPRAVVKRTATGDNLIQRGILEQRDKFLKILMRSKKVVAMLAGDEHNFNLLKITKEMNLYPAGWEKEDIRNSPEFRPLYQIINGAMGAPSAGPAKTPWSTYVQGFSNQNAVVLFHVDGKSVQLEVINPDTLDTVWPLQALSLTGNIEGQ